MLKFLDKIRNHFKTVRESEGEKCPNCDHKEEEKIILIEYREWKIVFENYKMNSVRGFICRGNYADQLRFTVAKF